MGTYADIYGGKRGAYQEAKFYAEPTTMLPEASDLRGANLVKGNTPYPTFMPYLVKAIVECYDHFTGPERLRRRGAEIREHGPTPRDLNRLLGSRCHLPRAVTSHYWLALSAGRPKMESQQLGGGRRKQTWYLMREWRDPQLTPP